MKKTHTRKRGHFQSSDGIAQRKLSLEQPYFVPQWRGLKKRGGYYGVQQAQTTLTLQQYFRQLYPQLILLPQEDDLNRAEPCPDFLSHMSRAAQHILNTGGGDSKQPGSGHLNGVNHTENSTYYHLLHSHSKVQVKLYRFSLLYIYNHSLLENPGAHQPLVIAKSI